MVYKNGIEMLFKNILWFYGCGFSVIQVKASKFNENSMIKRTVSQEEFQKHKWI